MVSRRRRPPSIVVARGQEHQDRTTLVHFEQYRASSSEIRQSAVSELDISIHLGGDMGLRCCDRLELGMEAGTLLSLFALRSATVSLSGARWPLERERIEFSDRGLSNLAEGGPVLLEVHEGGPVLMILSSGDND